MQYSGKALKDEYYYTLLLSKNGQRLTETGQCSPQKNLYRWFSIALQLAWFVP